MKFRAVLAVLCASMASTASAQTNSVCGQLSDLTSIEAGIMVMINSPSVVPSNCANPSANWMLIPNSRSAMLALTLSLYINDRRSMCIYTAPTAAGYCDVIQVDPTDS